MADSAIVQARSPSVEDWKTVGRFDSVPDAVSHADFMIDAEECEEVRVLESSGADGDDGKPGYVPVYRISVVFGHADPAEEAGNQGDRGQERMKEHEDAISGSRPRFDWWHFVWGSFLLGIPLLRKGSKVTGAICLALGLAFIALAVFKATGGDLADIVDFAALPLVGGVVAAANGLVWKAVAALAVLIGQAGISTSLPVTAPESVPVGLPNPAYWKTDCEAGAAAGRPPCALRYRSDGFNLDLRRVVDPTGGLANQLTVTAATLERPTGVAVTSKFNLAVKFPCDVPSSAGACRVTVPVGAKQDLMALLKFHMTGGQGALIVEGEGGMQRHDIAATDFTAMIRMFELGSGTPNTPSN